MEDFSESLHGASKHFFGLYRKVLYKIPDVAAVDRREIFQPNISYCVFHVHPAMGRLMRWVLDGHGYGIGQSGRRMWKGLGNMMGNWDRVVGGQGW